MFFYRIRMFLYEVRTYIGIGIALLVIMWIASTFKKVDRYFGFGSSRTVVQRPVQPTGQPAPINPNSAIGQTVPPSSTTVDARVQLSQAQGLLSEASVYVSEAVKQAMTWQHDVEPLRDRVLGEPDPSAESSQAEREKLFRRFDYVMNKERLQVDELNAANTRIEVLRKKVDGLTRQATTSGLSIAEMAEVSELHAKSKKANEDWSRDVKQAMAIVHLIERGSASPETTPSPPTIGSKTDDASAKSVVDDLDDEIEDEKKKKADDLRKEQLEAELLAKATSPEVTAVLAPFLHARSAQPRRVGGGSVHFRSTFDEAPMSLSALKTIGALEPSTEGLKWLARVGGSRRLSDPRWGVASQPNNWSADDRKLLKDAQQYLREYGPILVKDGKLSK